MTPTTLAAALHEAIEATAAASWVSPRRRTVNSDLLAAALLALPPDQRAAIAAELLDVETLAACLNDAQMLPSEIRLGRDLTVIAARILAALGKPSRRAKDWSNVVVDEGDEAP